MHRFTYIGSGITASHLVAWEQYESLLQEVLRHVIGELRMYDDARTFESTVRHCLLA